ncbi:MAG: TRL-like family protein [Nitrospira sp.]|nr:TRL-like family protein [Nitrospira sp.]
MTVIKLAATSFLFIFISISHVWAFGPHSSSYKSEGIELPQGIPAYQNYTSPISYLSSTRRDVVALSRGKEVFEVEGKSAKTRIFIPLGFLLGLSPTSGVSFDVMDRSIDKAIDDAKSRYGTQTLYDVRIDRHVFSILGIYTKTTTIVHAKGIK